jgi:2-oxoglutarate ferredoxin oxidoreductase subunit gamma
MGRRRADVEHSVVFAGFGGQGLLFAGHVLAEAAMREGRHVSWLPSYGPEMRGGTASCGVIIADRPIGSPLVDEPASLVALNPPSLAKFEPQVAAGGLIVVNASLVEAEVQRQDVEVLCLSCTDLARAAGDDRLVSVVALGGLLARRPIVRKESVGRALRALLAERPAGILEADLAAFESGWSASLELLPDKAAPAVL